MDASDKAHIEGEGGRPVEVKVEPESLVPGWLETMTSSTEEESDEELGPQHKGDQMIRKTSTEF